MAAGDIRQQVLSAIATYGDPTKCDGAVESQPIRLDATAAVEYIGASCEVTRAPTRLPDTWPYWTLYTQLREGVWQTWGCTYAASGVDTENLSLVTSAPWKLVGTNLVLGDSAIITIHYRA